MSTDYPWRFPVSEAAGRHLHTVLGSVIRARGDGSRRVVVVTAEDEGGGEDVEGIGDVGEGCREGGAMDWWGLYKATREVSS